MSDNTNPFQLRYLVNPLYWPVWFGLGVLYVITLLPYAWMLHLGTALGWLGYTLMPQRRRITRTNIRLVYPSLDNCQTRQLVKECFYSSSIAVLESAWAWWASDAKIKPLLQIEGLEHLRAAEALNKGVLMLGGHYTTLEISGRLLAYERDNVYPTYKPAHNDLFEAMMTRNRRRMNKGLVPSGDMRSILKLLKQQQIIWYAPDQDFGIERSVFAPFMGIQTATLTMSARLAKASGAPIVPFYSERLPGKQGYRLRFAPMLENFPSGDDVQDAASINAAIEQHVRQVPAQYLWGHRRFKTRPRGDKQVYQPRRGRHLRRYTYVHALLALPVIAYTLWTALRHKDMAYLRERLGLGQHVQSDLIIHAASIGEIKAVIPLIELVLARHPHISILLSMNTPSGRNTAYKQLGDRVRYSYMPIDWHWAVSRYMGQIRPRCVWIMETELWLNFYEYCYAEGIRNIIINARLSARSVDAPLFVRYWLSQAIQYTYAILARSEEDAKRFLGFNAAAEYVQVLGNIKYAAPAANHITAIDLGRDYVLLASSRDGEEKLIAQTWLSLPGDKPMLVIVPRHIKRITDILNDLQPLTSAIAVRSRGETVCATTALYLADTFGELTGFIQGARFVIMGGSFEAFGGQNIIEVAQAGKAVVFGPHMENFHSEAKQFISASAAIQVDDQHQLAATLTNLLQDSQQLRVLGDNGKTLATRYAHIAEDYFNQLEAYCPILTAHD